MDARLPTTHLPTFFSNCSISDYNQIMRDQLECLTNVPDMTETGPRCGNGIVEDNEVCDCGGPTVCKNRCCNADTCQLSSGAECATGQCCNISTCRSYGSEKVCRSSRGECDVQETCMGNSNACPRDTYRMNGIPCSSDNGYCYNGQCPTHASQCQAAWSKYQLIIKWADDIIPFITIINHFVVY